MSYGIVNLVSVIISILLILLAFLKPDKSSNFFRKRLAKIQEFCKRQETGIVIILLFLTIFTSLFRIEQIPDGMHIDEVGMAYDAKSIVENGTDRAGNRLPIYLKNYGGGQSVMYAYLAAIFIKLFGYSLLTVRMPAVLLRIAMFACLYWISKEEKSKKKMFLLLYFFAISPYFIMQSRWGLDCNLLVGFLTIAVCFFIQAIRKNTNRWLLIGSGIFFGLSLYTYILSCIIVPILLFGICVYTITIQKMKWSDLFFFGVPIFILAIPLMLFVLINKGIIPEIQGIITIPLLQTFRENEISIRNIPQSKKIVFSIFSFDRNPSLIYNALPYFGTMYYCTIPFFLIGFVKAIGNMAIAWKKKEFQIDTIFIFWFFSVLICMLIIFDPNINKANAIFMPILYLTILGIRTAIEKKRSISVPILLLLTIQFGMFFTYYNLHYTNQTSKFFRPNYSEALAFGKEMGQENVYLYFEEGTAEYMETLLENDVPTKQFGQNTIPLENGITYHFGIPKEPDAKGIHILDQTTTNWTEIEDLHFERKLFGRYVVFYPTE